MARIKNLQYELNQELTTPAVFLDAYNKNIPSGFPKATANGMKHFQTGHPLLFKQRDAWSIDKHRKRLMDWLVSNHGVE